MSITAPSSPRQAPLALWRIAQVFLAALHHLFGAPEDVAREGYLPRARRQQLAGWLRSGEAMLRRLLLIEAAALEPAPPAAWRLRAPRTRRLVEHKPDAPENWRVSFRCFPPARRRAGKPRRATPARRRDAADAWPAAERYEALLRAYNDPTPYARRLARRLRAAPQRAHAPLAQAAIDHISHAECAALTQAAGAAAEIFFCAPCIRAPPP
jgi:hypothetical protein